MSITRISELDHLRIGPAYNESEFLAEEYPIEIQPQFNSGEPLRFISQECGPFDRRSTLYVPLWIAVYLERHGKCNIKEPNWLNLQSIKQKLREEREKGSESFASFDDHFYQVAVILLNRDYLSTEYLGGQLVRDQILSILTEIHLVRKAKTLEGLKNINVTTNIVDISNMTSIERASIRCQSSVIMDTLMEYWSIRDRVYTR